MSSAQDPFYIVKEEIQESIDRLQSSFQEWERLTSTSGEQTRLRKELLTVCESIEWQVDELEKAIAVASRDPSRYRTDEVELQSRRGWTKKARKQVGTIKEALSTGKAPNNWDYGNVRGMHTELVTHSGDSTREADRSNQYAQDDDDFIVSESDRQLLLIKQQDEELDELSATVRRIGNVGLTIHDELLAQEKIIDELGMDMDSTTNRLDFLQLLSSKQRLRLLIDTKSQLRKTLHVSRKKVSNVMKKAGAKGQILMMLALLVLLIILFLLVFSN